LLIIIAIIAFIGCFYTVYQLPQSLVRGLISIVTQQHYTINVVDIKNIPSQNGTLLVGNHTSDIDWASVQIASPRPVRFILPKIIYEQRYLKRLLKLMRSLPIQADVSSQTSLKKIAALLDAGEVVCVFTELTASSEEQEAHKAQFNLNYEQAYQLAQKDITIIPFYLGRPSDSGDLTSTKKRKNKSNNQRTKEVMITFGKPLPKSTPARTIQDCIADLSINSKD
jgi:acyl-[acyl-carrier-protein]-phospholipid O-acyltransferase/long-chain-fatty-acid--[acyl-carrier-protein] ligase